jgi:TetR/AcrR family transcriptional regulator, cholesterol catabolism regulator
VEAAKRDEIIDAATRRFGRYGYESTKWADIAADVGVGPTALYHYFESKQHCLFVILGQAMADFRARFERLAGGDRPPPTHLPSPLPAPFTGHGGSDYLTTLVALLQDCFRLTEHDIQRNRVVVAEQGLLMNPRQSPREEQSRQAARQLTRDLERLWAAFLAGAMEQGAIPDGDPRLLARAILGLYNSVWHWYRPNGIVALPRVAEFFVARSLALAGVAPDVAESVLLVA